MKKIKLILENYLAHKEQIAPSIIDSLRLKNHYCANNHFYPETLSKSAYLPTLLNDKFKQILPKFKRAWDIYDVTPENYFKIKKEIPTLYNSILKEEESQKENLFKLAENCVQKCIGLPDGLIKFQVGGYDLDEIDGTDLLDNIPQNTHFSNYGELQNVNKELDREKLAYNKVCGGAFCSMNPDLFIGELDDINYKLPKMYSKLFLFNLFNLYVSPDNIVENEYVDEDKFQIYDTGSKYLIRVGDGDLLSILYNMTKAVLSILFQVKYSNTNLDYKNIWNTRIGVCLWDKLSNPISDKTKLPYIVDALNQMKFEDYQSVMNEMLTSPQEYESMLKGLQI